MSMNLYIEAIREVTVAKTGKQSIQSIDFDLWQTPTDVTEEILESDNHLQSYIDWVNEGRQEQQIPVYHDILGNFCGGEIIGYKSYCPHDDHIKKLKKFISESEDEGYEIKFYAY